MLPLCTVSGRVTTTNIQCTCTCGSSKLEKKYIHVYILYIYIYIYIYIIYIYIQEATRPSYIYNYYSDEILKVNYGPAFVYN